MKIEDQELYAQKTGVKKNNTAIFNYVIFYS